MIIPRLLIASGCAPAPGGPPRDPATRVGCGVSGIGSWLAVLPSRLGHLLAQWWPWLAAGVLLAVLVVLAGRAAHRAAWRRAVDRGYWVELTPTRTPDPRQAAQVWRLLGVLARHAASGRHLTAPPLAFEMYARGGRMVAGLWLPGSVPWPAVAAEVSRAWPDARAQRRVPPRVVRDGWPVAGYRLAAGSDTAPLTDDTRPATRGAGGGGDPLRPVLVGLGRPGGAAALQVLVRPAPRRRLAALRHAARYPTTARPPTRRRMLDGAAAVALGTVRLLLDLVGDLISTGHSTNPGSPHGGNQPRPPADPLAAKAMRDAAEKLADAPHLLATVRVVAARPDSRSAVAAARSIADGFIVVSRVLTPVRIRRAGTRLADRRARRGDWLLCTASELDALAHLPTDPARYGFATAAVHRPHPVTAPRATPERRTSHGPGWTPTGWTHPTPPRSATPPAPTGSTRRRG